MRSCRYTAVIERGAVQFVACMRVLALDKYQEVQSPTDGGFSNHLAFCVDLSPVQ